MGAGYSSFLKRILNGQAQKTFSEPLFKAWHRHNTIEVGTFENFLPSLWKQRDPTDHFKTLTFDAQTMNAASSYPQEQMPADATLFHERVPGEQRSRSRRDHCESCDGEGRKSKTLVKNGEASLLCRKILGCIVLARLNLRTRSIFPLRGTTLIGADMTGALQQSGLRSRTCEFTRLSTCSQKDLCLWGNIEISKTSLDGAFRRRRDLKG